MENIDKLQSSINRQSWNFIERFYEDWVSKPQWAYLMPLLCLVKTISRSERAAKFQAGQSVTDLKISTVPYHGLKAEEPFVSISVHDVQNNIAVSFEVIYWRSNHSVGHSWLCSENELLSILDTALTQLEAAPVASK